MSLAPTSVISWIIVILAVVKIIGISINPKGWLNSAKKIWARKGTVQISSLILAAIVLYYLLQEITIIQIFDTLGFAGLLFAIGLSSEIPTLLKRYETQIKKGSIWKDYWFYLLIWIILIFWVLTELI